MRNLAFAAALILTTHFVSAQVAAPGTAPIQSSTVAALAPTAGPTYDNKWDFYGGLSFMNGQPDRTCPSATTWAAARYMGTYWLGNPKSDSYIMKHLGVISRLPHRRRHYASSQPNQYYLNRVLIRQQIMVQAVSSTGADPRTATPPVDYHALVGGTYGVFDTAVKGYPVNSNTPFGQPCRSLPGPTTELRSDPTHQSRPLLQPFCPLAQPSAAPLISTIQCKARRSAFRQIWSSNTSAPKLVSSSPSL